MGTFADKGFYLELVDWLINRGKASSVLPSVEGFEATERVNAKNHIVFALNHNRNTISVPCDGVEFKDLLSGGKVKGRIDLGAFGVRVLLRQS